MTIRVICWDWNGTLLDDVDICLRVMNSVLVEFDRAPINGVDAYRRLFRFPIQDFYADAGLGSDVFRAAAEKYLRLLPLHIGNARLHTGAHEVLTQIAGQGVRQVLASATLSDALEHQLGPHDIAGHFEQILSIDDPYRASKAEVIAEWSAAEGVDPSEMLVIGDTNHDREIAAALGTRFVHFAAGHQVSTGDEARIDRLADLIPLLASSAGGRSGAL